MENYVIKYPSYFDEIEDIENDNIDVFIETEDGFTYTLVVTTPKYLFSYMDKEGVDFIPAAPPEVIVKKLSKEVIEKAVKTYLEDDSYWLKLYFLAGTNEGLFDVKEMDKILDKIKRTNKDIFG
ncbi:hypothetical protein EDM59_06655 [Brevibacillus nitrificans]|uniref:Uncharacterized protein n=1 Tax=Brevibacillus nitrificans TaxID=651560 RepID=A0A3M8DL12_9BACL|nr:hypothetical protein [Brevibacillus nitrificans]RNB88782.1 hypothetical protein EDM59_06655 [Brevibacillus nitrificans]